MNEDIKVGCVYERRDERRAYVYSYNPVHDSYDCILEGTGQVFSVNFDGAYLSSGPNHNDLVKLVK